MSLIKFQILKDSGKLNSLSPEQEQIMALASEVTTLKDQNVKLENSVKSSKNKNSLDKPKGTGKGKNTARRQLMKRSGLGRKFHPRREIPSPSRCLTSTRLYMCVKTIKHGLVIPQSLAEYALQVKKQKHLKILLQCLKVLGLMNKTLSLCLVYFMLGN
jgi:hypothetical protein